MQRPKVFLELLICFLTVFYIVSCRKIESSSSSLPFETVLLKSDAYWVHIDDVDIFIASNQADMQGILDEFRLNYQKQGGQLGYDSPFGGPAPEIVIDYDDYVVMIACFGEAGHGGNFITIEEVVQTGKMVDMKVTLVRPAGGDTIVTSPVHVVQISKDAFVVKGVLTFNLWEDGKLIVTKEQRIR